MTTTQQQKQAPPPLPEQETIGVSRRDSSAPFEDVELACSSSESSAIRSKETTTDAISSDESSARPEANDHEDDDASEEEEKDEVDEEARPIMMRRWSFWIKLILGLLLLGFIIFAIVDSTTTGYVRSGFESFLAWIQNNLAAGFFVFVLVYFVATVLFFPGAILTLGAGFIFSMAFGLGWGVVIGSVCVLFGASLGAIVSFILGRFLLREQVDKLSQKYQTFAALETAIQANGLKIFILLRLSPIIPFNVINYLGGVTSVSFRDYCIALIAIIPGTVLYVFLGSSTGSLANIANSGQNATVTIVVVAISLVFGILALLITTRYAKRELNRIVEAREREAQQGAAETENEEGDIEQQSIHDDNVDNTSNSSSSSIADHTPITAADPTTPAVVM